jgi:hypothetical protein
MALVIFFVPEPVRGVAEMARVVCPGGAVAAYAWDMLGGGFPWNLLQVEMRALGTEPLLPPSADASRMAALQDLWTSAGPRSVDFEDFWSTATIAASVRPALESMTASDADLLKTRVRARLPERQRTRHAPRPGQCDKGARTGAIW